TAAAAPARRGIAGKQVTPFLLARVRELTGGPSQRANVALVLNNARLAAQIARELAGAGTSESRKPHDSRAAHRRRTAECQVPGDTETTKAFRHARSTRRRYGIPS